MARPRSLEEGDYTYFFKAVFQAVPGSIGVIKDRHNGLGIRCATPWSLQHFDPSPSGLSCGHKLPRCAKNSLATLNRSPNTTYSPFRMKIFRVIPSSSIRRRRAAETWRSRKTRRAPKP